jgi:hypothetical protein
VVPAAAPLVALPGDVVALLGASVLDDGALPVVPDIPLDAEPLPIIALVSVHAPLVPCRHPVSVMFFDAPVVLWSQAPEVPVLVGDEVAGSCGGVVLVPGCEPLGVCAARVTANAQAMATLDAVVTTRFM